MIIELHCPNPSGPHEMLGKLRSQDGGDVPGLQIQLQCTYCTRKAKAADIDIIRVLHEFRPDGSVYQSMGQTLNSTVVARRGGKR